jgi:hypothetical protein
MRLHRDEGIAALWFAITIVFILGVAALSVDAGGFFSRAYDEQRAGDFACLSGVVELPADPAAARTVAAGYLATNLDLPQPAAANGFSAAANTWDLRAAGYPWVFELDPDWGTDTQMKVHVLKYEATRFGRAIGSDQIRIDQNAYCELFGAVPGGIFPVGVQSGFNGGKIKFSASDCTTESPSGPGQCDFVDFPRFDDPPGTDAAGSAPQRLLYNMWLGSNQPLTTWDGVSGHEVFCGDTPSTTPCNVLDMAGVAGNRASYAYNGLVRGDQNGSSPTKFLGHLEYGRQPAPASTRPVLPHGWTQTHSNNMWNVNLLHNSAVCGSSNPGCSGDDQPLADPPNTFDLTSFDCQDRRFVWIPEGEFIGSGANQKFYIESFITAYLVDPIPSDSDSDGILSDGDADPISGNAISEISAVVVDLSDATFMYGSQGCPTSPFLTDENQPVIPKLIEP